MQSRRFSMADGHLILIECESKYLQIFCDSSTGSSNWSLNLTLFVGVSSSSSAGLFTSSSSVRFDLVPVCSFILRMLLCCLCGVSDDGGTGGGGTGGVVDIGVDMDLVTDFDFTKAGDLSRMLLLLINSLFGIRSRVDRRCEFS